MTNPAKAASQDADESLDNEVEENQDNSKAKEPTFETKINTIVDNITRDEKTGQYVLPDDLSEAEKFAAIAEKRRRDTQSTYTKSAQEVKALKAREAALLKRVSSAVTVELTKEQMAELEDLKFSDVDAWRKKVNALENEAINKQNEQIDAELKTVSTSSLEKEELERRITVLSEFNQAHPDFEITEDIVDNDIPPRIKKRLETGAITFEAFLQECYDYSKTGKVIKQEKLPNKQPNLSKVGGSSKPDDNAIKEDIVLSYNKEVF